MLRTSPRRSIAVVALSGLAAGLGGVAVADGPDVTAVVDDVTTTADPTQPRTLADGRAPLSLDELLEGRDDPATSDTASPVAVPRRPVPVERDARLAQLETEVMVSSWYGPNFHGQLTANGEPFDQWGLTAAHKTLPFGTRLRVTSVETGRSVEVRVNDRGPFIEGRDLDLSRAAAEAIGLRGVASVEVAEL